MWSWGCPTYAKKQVKNVFFVFLGCFWAYVGQPHDHISWAKPMPFASINSTYPRTNPWNFHKKILRIGGAGKWPFFRQPFWFFFLIKKQTNLLHLIEKTKGFHMRYHFFLYYRWFLQNLRKDFFRTNMHTTVSLILSQSSIVLTNCSNDLKTFENSRFFSLKFAMFNQWNIFFSHSISE